VALFEYLQLFDGILQPCGMEEWQGLELSPGGAHQKPFLHDDFYPVYSDMRRYENGDHAFGSAPLAQFCFGSVPSRTSKE
jgi:hypothetical protein